MICSKCNKHVVTKTTKEERGEFSKDTKFADGIKEGQKHKVTVHWCTECGAEIPPLKYDAGKHISVDFNKKIV
jgi:hypothetical protein